METQNIIKGLKDMGVDISKYTKSQLNQLINISSEISDPSDILNSPEILTKISNILNINIPHQQKSPIKKTKKISRNDKCFCNSGKKYKKCCISKN